MEGRCFTSGYSLKPEGGARHPKAPQKPNRCLISCSEVELIALHREGTTAGSCLSWRPHTHDPLEVISLIPEPPPLPIPVTGVVAEEQLVLLQEAEDEEGEEGGGAVASEGGVQSEEQIEERRVRCPRGPECGGNLVQPGP